MSVDVAIIGAGAAGIAAARRLRGSGASVVLLEARDRIGGRAHTNVARFGYPVDLGCAWLHFADHNPWTDYARAHGFTVIDQAPGWNRRVGGKLPAPEELEAWQRAWQRNDALVEAAARAGRDVAVSEVIPQDHFRARYDAVMTWLVGVDSDRVSTVDLARYQDSEDDWAVAEGLGAVVAHAARGLPVQRDTAVDAIEWGSRELTLFTRAGPLHARAVIVTVPTSVLAQGRLRFDPMLPQEYQRAFEQLPLGVVDKVFFDVDPAALPLEGTVHTIGSDTTARTASYALRPAGAPAVLAFFGGSFAQELEERDALEGYAREELGRIFGSRLQQGLRRSLVARWGTDPWALGSYSAAQPGCASAREQLALPVTPQLHFAGEACSLQHFGTIMGAWTSGESAAGRVLETLAASSQSAGQPASDERAVK